MPYLNWKESGLSQEARDLGTRKGFLLLKINFEEIQELCSHLEELFVKGSHDLRLALPGEWLLFWKRREEGSRALLAHPEPNEWVATVALEQADGKKWFEALKVLKIGESLTLGQCVSLASVSNLDITISVKE